MSKRDTCLLLEDILESCKKITSYTEGLNFETFISDDRTLDAVIRNFEIIGEAANRIPESFCNQHAEIAWHQMIGMRNRLIHAYFGVDYSIIWDVVENTLPLFMKQISGILLNEL
jgi:uncharacterized protein with HEPN domain